MKQKLEKYESKGITLIELIITNIRKKLNLYILTNNKKTQKK